MQIDKEALLANAKPLSNTLPIGLSLAPNPSQAPAVTPAAPVLVCSVDEVTSVVDDWASAWRKKDTDTFLKFYADKFEPDTLQTKDEWIEEKTKSLSTKSKVSLKLKGVQVKCDGNKAAVKFNQDYKLTSFKIKKVGNNASCEVCNMKRIPVTNFASNLNKELHFERVADNWKIVKELVAK